jgi:RND family efflux transporter MFP subunit
MDIKKTVAIVAGILIVGAAITLVIFSTEPEAERSGATRETAMLVDVVQAQKGNYNPVIRAMGTVMPSEDIVLSPRVSGQIVERSENFAPGGYVEEGEMLLQIDPADFENVLRQRRSELQQAETELAIEMGRQNVARQDFELLDESLTGVNQSLVLREPQLDAARARVESAQAALRQAELNLERTTIRAPFDAYILSRNADIGSQVTPGDNLGRLVGIDEYWVEATVPQASLQWIDIPRNGETGSVVDVYNRTSWEDGRFREGRLFRLIGKLTNQTRMARILITVPDPHGYESDQSDLPRLMIGSFVESAIQAKELENVVRISRDYIRQDDTAWIMKNDTLRIRNLDILFRDAQYAYVSSGIEDGERVVTTNLSTVVNGAPLRLEESASETERTPVTDAGL